MSTSGAPIRCAHDLISLDLTPGKSGDSYDMPGADGATPPVAAR